MFRITGTVLFTLLAASLPAQMQERPPDPRKRPLALVREASEESKMRRAGFKSSGGIVAGDLIFEGDTLIPNGRPVKVLHCPARAMPPQPGTSAVFTEIAVVNDSTLAAGRVPDTSESA